MSSAALRLVPSRSMKVVGWLVNSSVSLAAIQVKRGDRSSLLASRAAFTKCQRNTESAVAQPTHDPVEPWSLMLHQVSRRSLDVGIGAAASMPAAMAFSTRQSFSVSRDGMQLRMRITPFAASLGCLACSRAGGFDFPGLAVRFLAVCAMTRSLEFSQP